MRILCPILVGGSFLPARCMNAASPGGHGVSPAFQWSDVPPGTKSFVLVMTDLDADDGESILWYVANISASTREMSERASGVRDLLPEGATELRTTSGQFGYAGPMVHPVDPPHKIAVRLIAIKEPKLKSGLFASGEEIVEEVKAEMLAEASLECVATRAY